MKSIQKRKWVCTVPLIYNKTNPASSGVFHHTLVIEILGKIANAENYTLEELENRLVQDGFDLEGIASNKVVYRQKPAYLL